MRAKCSVCLQSPAKYECPCASPPVALCLECLTPHQKSEGTHTPEPISRKSPAKSSSKVQVNEICDLCHALPAVRFCLCVLPLRKYCEECDVAHYRKAPLLSHSEHPVGIYSKVANGRLSMEVFKKKQQFINDLTLRMGLELVNFDAFVQKVEQEFEGLLEAVQKKKEALLEDLRKQRAKLEGLLNDAQKTVDAKRYEETFTPKTEFDELLLSGYNSATPATIRIFSGKIHLDEVKEQLNLSVSYKVSFKIKAEPTVTTTPGKTSSGLWPFSDWFSTR